MPERDLIGEALRQVREACLFDDDAGAIGITTDPHISAELFALICKATPALAAEREEAKERERMLRNKLRDHALELEDLHRWRCLLCGERWIVERGEHHAPGCLAAIPEAANG